MSVGLLKRMAVATGWSDGPSLGRKTRQGGPFERGTFRASSRQQDSVFHSSGDSQPLKAETYQRPSKDSANGYQMDIERAGSEAGKIEIDPDEHVVAAIRLVFAKFAELGSARQVFLWMRSAEIKMPVVLRNIDVYKLIWKAPACRSCIPRARIPDRSRSGIATAARRWDCRHSAGWCRRAGRRSRQARSLDGHQDRGGV